MAVIARIISGGQTGVDLAGLEAARSCGIATGGTAPKGYRTEAGPRAELLRGFGLVENDSPAYRVRTAANVAAGDATLIIARHLDRGSALTARLCDGMSRPCWIVQETDATAASATADWLTAQRRTLGRPLVLNVAGNRESRDPGIEERARLFLVGVLRSLAAA